MSPECLFGKKQKYYSDFYSLGVVCFELIYRKKPFVGKNKKDLKELILFKKIRLYENSLYSETLCNFINSLLERNTYKRIGFKKGIKELEEHFLFEDMNWKLIYEQKETSPWKEVLDYSKVKYCFDDEIYDREFCSKKNYIGSNTKMKYAKVEGNLYFANQNFFRNFTYIALFKNINNICLKNPFEINNIISQKELNKIRYLIQKNEEQLPNLPFKNNYYEGNSKYEDLLKSYFDYKILKYQKLKSKIARGDYDNSWEPHFEKKNESNKDILLKKRIDSYSNKDQFTSRSIENHSSYKFKLGINNNIEKKEEEEKKSEKKKQEEKKEEEEEEEEEEESFDSNCSICKKARTKRLSVPLPIIERSKNKFHSSKSEIISKDKKKSSLKKTSSVPFIKIKSPLPL